MIPLISLLLFALAAEPIGAVGSTVDLPAGWKREALSPSVGSDQFHSSNGIFTIVREIRAPFYEDADLHRQLRAFAVGLEARGGKAEGDVRYGERGGVRHAEQYWRATIGGQALAYNLQVVGKGALGYVALSWAPINRRVPLHRAARQLRFGITFPGEGSEWAKLNAPVAAESTIVGHTIRYAYPPAVFEPLAEDARGDAFAAIQSDGEQNSIFLLAVRSDDGADAVLDGAMQVLAKLGTDVKVAPAEDATIGGRPARVVHAEGVAKAGGPFSTAVAVVQMEEDIFLDLRFLAYGSMEARGPLWDAFLASVALESEPVVDAFPPPAPTPSKRTLTPQQSGLLGAATLVGAVTYGGAFRLVGDELFVEGYRGVTRHALADGAKESAVAIPTEGKARLPVPRKDGLYVPTTAGEVFRVLDAETAEGAGFEATLLADAGARGLLVVRELPGVSVPGYGAITATSRRRVILRDDAGNERLVTEVVGDVHEAVVSGDEALLVTSAEPGGYGERRLQALALADGATRPLGAWSGLESIAADGDTWLVTGTPEDAPSGVWRVTRAGARTLLVSGDHVGAFPGADGGLLLVTRWHPPDAAVDAYTPVALRVPARAVSEFGPRFAPLTAAYVQDVAVAALASLGLASEPTKVLADPASIRRFVEAASRVAEKGVGVPLPRDADGVDELINRAAGEARLHTEGYLLLTAVLSDHLLREGAVWAAGRPLAGLSMFGEASAPENDHARGYFPLEIVRSTLRDSEGWYSPATSIRDGLDGRVAVLGVDADAVRAKVEAARRPGLDEVLKQPIPQVVAWLEAERKNVHLRGVVYERLAAAGRVAELAEIAAPFLDPADPAYVDAQASLAGRVARGAGEGDAALVTDLRAAIAKWPSRGELYVLLGSVYERGTAPDRAQLAAACYRHVAEELRWSASAEQAREGLARVEKK